jgi:hypothetical protein
MWRSCYDVALEGRLLLTPTNAAFPDSGMGWRSSTSAAGVWRRPCPLSYQRRVNSALLNPGAFDIAERQPPAPHWFRSLGDF